MSIPKDVKYELTSGRMKYCLVRIIQIEQIGYDAILASE